MSAITELEAYSGLWQGQKKLWLTPDEPVRESPSQAEIQIVSGGQFSELRYTWSAEGQPQEGRLLLGRPDGKREVNAVWLDTWHMAHQFMVLTGEADGKGNLLVRGSYPAPTGPDWGWEIGLEPGGRDAFRLAMYNLTPDGQRYLAVEIEYSRR